jgi:two-component system, cell cycle sensor histidine kinase and response regulator CckA
MAAVFQLAAIAVFTLCAQGQEKPQEPRRNVLVLNSYHETYAWTHDLVDSLAEVLSREFPGIEIYSEHMDSRRFSGSDHFRRLRQHLEGKYGTTRLDAIITTDDAALSFLAEQGPSFLGGPPVVFGGVSSEALILSADRNRFTGVREKFHYSSLVSLLLTMRPETRRIAVVLDNSENASSFQVGFARAIGATPSVEVEMVEGGRIGFDGVLERLAQLPPDSAVISMAYVIDRNGTHLEPRESMARIARASSAPVVSPNVSELGQGILCGNANGARQHAEWVSGLTASVLRGVAPADLPVMTDGIFGPVVDYAAMRRFGIDGATLAGGAQIINLPANPLQPYRGLLIGLGIFLAVQMVTIILLVSNIIARRKAVFQLGVQAQVLEERNRSLDNLNRSILSEYSARENAEKALRESERRYRDMVENALDSIYSHDLSGRFTEVNRTMCELLGYSRDELIGYPIEKVLTPGSREIAREMTALKLAGASSPHYELTAVTKAGRHAWIEVSSRLIWAHGFPAGVEGIARDVTSRKSLEEELRQARQMDALGRLSGGVAHDFNNILTVVTGYSDLLLMTLPATDPSRAKVEEIHRAGERATELTRKLLAFGRTQAAPHVSGDLHRTLAECAEMLRYLAPPPVEVNIRAAPGPAPVQCDPVELQQVLLNLSLNARDAMPNGGRLDISTGVNDSIVELTVSDTGFGMDEATRARVFDPFFTTKEPGRGTGLGLSTVYGIVRRAGGRIEIESAPDIGTTVTVRLPLVQQLAGEPLQARTGESPRGKLEIVFLVDDQEEVRSYTSEVLKQLGYTVRAFEGARPALQAMNERPSLLITDVVMPGIAGPELARMAQERYPKLPVLFVSGYPGPEQQATAGQAFLPKPFTPAQLAEAVSSAVTPS